MGLALLAGCGSSPFRLEVRPTIVAADAEIEIRALAPDGEKLTTGIASRLDLERSGTWVPVAHLFFALPGGRPIARPYSPEGPAVPAIGYSAGNWSRLRLPPGLAPGRYRIVKDDIRGSGSEAHSIAAVFTVAG